MQTKLVLDTNVVLDWLVFADPLLMRLELAMNHQRIELLTHPITLSELQQVLTYPELKLDSRSAAQVMNRYLTLTTPAALPDTLRHDNLLLPAGFPLCSDTDDQIFLALAYHDHATLVTRDRALLKLKRRAARFGVNIVEAAYLPTQLT